MEEGTTPRTEENTINQNQQNQQQDQQLDQQRDQQSKDKKASKIDEIIIPTTTIKLRTEKMDKYHQF